MTEAERIADLEAQVARLREALEDLIRWATVAFDGLEYEREAEREALWEKLAGQPDDPCALDRARAALNPEGEG